AVVFPFWFIMPATLSGSERSPSHAKSISYYINNEERCYSTCARSSVMAKTSCPVSRAQFRDKAKSVSVTINNVPFQAVVKEFSTGSLGWFLNGKTTIE